MAKLSLIQRVVSPKHSGAKKNLLSRGGITSDGAVEDDDSSSLSDREKRQSSSKSKKKFSARNLFRRIGTKSSGDDDGYESDTSDGSTRSTSSSFLRYQNRGIWKSKFMKKSILQRKGDGTEAPVVKEETTKPWPIFDKIYNRQNQKVDKNKVGGEGDFSDADDDDNDSISSDGPVDECPLAPPPPTFAIGSEEEECVLDEDDLEEGVGKVAGVGTSLATSTQTSITKVPDKRVPLSSEEKSIEVSPKSEAPSTQESGIPTAEAPKTKTTPSPPQARLGASQIEDTTKQHTSQNLQSFPTQKLSNTQTEMADGKNTKSASKKSPRKKNVSKAPEREVIEVTPSIPRTICYSLRSAIGDGTARQRNSHSLMERRPLMPNGSQVECSYWSHKGNRNYMEDRFVIEHMGSIGTKKEDKKPITLLAVFDGHGGSVASQFCSDWLSSYIRKKNEFFPHNLPMAMKSSFVKIDKDVVASGNLDGTTACACTVVGRKVVCCNTGDSRAIIVRRDGSAVALSDDHKPDRNDETKRINDLGGRVIHWGRWRVEGVLAVSRAIGDARLKPYVTAEPDIVEHDVTDDDMFLVVASDGVWDTMSSDLVAKFVLVNTCKIVDKGLKVDDKLLRWIARQVSKRARENGSSDNISCIVANLKSR